MSKSPPATKVNPVFEQSMRVTQYVHSANRSLLWSCINGVLFSVVLYDVMHKCPFDRALVHYIEVFAVLILGINTVYHLCRYIVKTCSIPTVVLTQRQKKLMGIKDLDPYIKEASTPANTSANDTPLSLGSDILSSTPMNLSSTSWQSLSMLSTTTGANVTSPNCSLSSPSWTYHPGTPQDLSRRWKQSPSSSLSRVTSDEIITDERSLTQYLHDYELQEKKAVVGSSVEPSSNFLSSFWNHPASRTSSEVSPLLRRCSYQLASPSPTQSSSTPTGSGEEGTSPSSSQYQNQEIWRRIRVNPATLTQWNANLRMWISQTVLDRLVKEIAAVDEALQRHGMTDVRIGLVGLERLKKTAQIQQVAQNIPTLPRLVPFLELTPHQEYLVARIKELAKGGCMSEFRWNGGGSLHGKPWEEHLPTDSAVVMHLFATYLDSQLPPLPHSPDGRPFTTQHFVKTPDKPPKGKEVLVIYQQQINSPHFVLVVGSNTWEVAKGHNNLFHTILLFLYQVNTREHGMLGRVNLGPSGLNLLWVIGS